MAKDNYMDVFGDGMSLRRSIYPTNAVMVALNREGTETQLAMQVEVGTSNKNFTSDDAKDNRNIYNGEVAFLPVDCDVLRVKFNIGITNNYSKADRLDSKIRGQVRETTGLFESYIPDAAKMFLDNVIDASCLWRNVEFAISRKVVVESRVTGKKWEFVNGVGEDLDGLKSEFVSYLNAGANIFRVTMDISLAETMEVWPSQLMNLDSTDNESRRFYKIPASNGNPEIPAIRSVKIGNKMRTFDSWFEEYDDLDEAIAVETFGGSLRYGEEFRSNGDDFYSLFGRVMKEGQSGMPENDKNSIFVAASLLKGGFFSKDKKNDKG